MLKTTRSTSSFRQKLLLFLIGALALTSVFLTVATYQILTSKNNTQQLKPNSPPRNAANAAGIESGNEKDRQKDSASDEDSNGKREEKKEKDDKAAGDSLVSSPPPPPPAPDVQQKVLIAKLQRDFDHCNAARIAAAEEKRAMAESNAATIKALNERVSSLEGTIVALKKQLIQDGMLQGKGSVGSSSHNKGGLGKEEPVGGSARGGGGEIIVDANEKQQQERPPAVRRHQPRDRFNNDDDNDNNGPYGRRHDNGERHADANRAQMQQQFNDRQSQGKSIEDTLVGSSSNNNYHGVIMNEALRREANSEAVGSVIPVLLFAYNRPQSLRQTMDLLLMRMPRQHHQDAARRGNGGGEGSQSSSRDRPAFRLFVSQDSLAFPEVTELLAEYSRQGKLVHMIHERSTVGMRPVDVEQGWEAYYAIAHHYRWAIAEVFKAFPSYDRMILLEEDLRVGVDFFEYMSATSFLLDEDPSLFCISAWNDNGKRALVSDPQQLYRTDFFPGLGWMSSREILMNELLPKWPNGFWDDWLRQPTNRRDRACIRPEVPRTAVSCDENGTSRGQFCDHIVDVKLSETAVNWTARKEAEVLHQTLLKEPYDRWLKQSVSSAAEVRDVSQLQEFARSGRSSKLAYHSNAEFVAIADALNLMNDFKDGVPRTAYKGVVTVKLYGTMVHLYATYRYTADDS